MGLKPKPYDGPIEVGNTGWAETRDCFPEDSILRKNGFRIYSRPRGQESLWSKEGQVYGHREALNECPEHREKMNARKPYEIKLRGGVGK